jgi:HSP20 family protein
MTTNRHLSKRNESQEERSPERFPSPVNRLFDESFFDPFRFFQQPRSFFTEMGRSFTPLVDVSETDKEVAIEADVPGYDPKSIHVDVSNNMLTISGKMEERPQQGKKWHRRERSYSYAEFRRQILLPDYVDGTHAACTMKHGKLLITIPKKPEAEPRHLEVKVES